MTMALLALETAALGPATKRLRQAEEAPRVTIAGVGELDAPAESLALAERAAAEFLAAPAAVVKTEPGAAPPRKSEPRTARDAWNIRCAADRVFTLE